MEDSSFMERELVALGVSQPDTGCRRLRREVVRGLLRRDLERVVKVRGPKACARPGSAP